MRDVAGGRAKITVVNVPAPRQLLLTCRSTALDALGALAAALLALPVLGMLLSALLPQGDAYHAGSLPLLAALGGLALTGCAGHLLAGRVSFGHEALLRACATFSRDLLPAAPAPDSGLIGSYEGAPPILPLLSSYFVLCGGLGGWVDRIVRRKVRRLAGSPALR